MKWPRTAGSVFTRDGATIVVECLYQARIDYDFTPGATIQSASFYDAISRFARSREKSTKQQWLSVNETTQGPCWNAYFVIQGTSRDSVLKATKQIVGKILRWKGAKILE